MTIDCKTILIMSFFFKYICLFIYLFGCVGFSLLRAGFSPVAASVVEVHGLLIAVASLVVEYGL